MAIAIYSAHTLDRTLTSNVIKLTTFTKQYISKDLNRIGSFFLFALMNQKQPISIYKAGHLKCPKTYVCLLP